MKTVEVYDRVNPKRLLGTMQMPDRRPDGRDIRFAAMAQLPLTSVIESPSLTETISTVTFEYGLRPSEDGWDQKGVLQTDAPLKVLMGVRDFRLPGEDQRQAYERQYRW